MTTCAPACKAAASFGWMAHVGLRTLPPPGDLGVLPGVGLDRLVRTMAVRTTMTTEKLAVGSCDKMLQRFSLALLALPLLAGAAGCGDAKSDSPAAAASAAPAV